MITSWLTILAKFSVCLEKKLTCCWNLGSVVYKSFSFKHGVVLVITELYSLTQFTDYHLNSRSQAYKKEFPQSGCCKALSEF